MKILKYMLGVVALITAASCAPEDEPKSFPAILNLENTVWESSSMDDKGKFYYNVISFEVGGVGTLSNYLTSNLEQPLSTHAFTYVYPLNERYGMQVRFDDGGRYDGYVIQKGNLQVDGKDVYVIQLFEVDENGYTILNDRGEPQSTMIFWKE